MELSMTGDEKELMKSLLHQYIGETLVEIRHSKIRDFKERLKEEEQTAEVLLAKISNMN
ncbi:MAG TPA: hypothetical protein PK926_17520 [Spirochaetota bacterium]|nr:hypothetical protein [Spirochaetota bacterium]HPI91115.1 hypothetical protein [Spirochaetota bacterium]HPR47711.1 hypothetical protein [Spirochaetota bacterium]